MKRRLSDSAIRRIQRFGGFAIRSQIRDSRLEVRDSSLAKQRHDPRCPQQVEVAGDEPRPERDRLRLPREENIEPGREWQQDAGDGARVRVHERTISNSSNAAYATATLHHSARYSRRNTTYTACAITDDTTPNGSHAPEKTPCFRSSASVCIQRDASRCPASRCLVRRRR